MLYPLIGPYGSVYGKRVPLWRVGKSIDVLSYACPEWLIGHYAGIVQ